MSRIDPVQATAEYRDRVMGAKGRNLDDAGRAALAEDLRSPCTEAVAVFQQFARAVAESRRGHVGIDTAPTGHTLLLLDTAGSYHREIARQMCDSLRYTTPFMHLQDPERTKVLLITLPEPTPSSKPRNWPRTSNAPASTPGPGSSTTQLRRRRPPTIGIPTTTRPGRGRPDPRRRPPRGPDRPDPPAGRRTHRRSAADRPHRTQQRPRPTQLTGYLAAGAPVRFRPAHSMIIEALSRTVPDEWRVSMSSSGIGTDIPRDQESGSDFFRATMPDTVLRVGAFAVLLSVIVSVASVTFGWDWIPRMFLAFLALSAALLIRSRALGNEPTAYEESVQLTTARFGLLSIVVLLVQRLS